MQIALYRTLDRTDLNGRSRYALYNWYQSVVERVVCFEWHLALVIIPEVPDGVEVIL